MAAKLPLDRVLPLMREFKKLERRRVGTGLTLLEFQRWSDLQHALESNFEVENPPEGGERRKSVRVPTRIRVEYENSRELRSAVITNVSRGGLFVNTAAVLEIGSELMLRIHVDDGDVRLDLPCVVVSNNVSNDFSTQALGMGLRFKALAPGQAEQLEALFNAALAESVPPLE